MIVYLISGHPELCAALERFADRQGSAVDRRLCRHVTHTASNESVFVVPDLASVRSWEAAQPLLRRAARHVVLVKPNQRLAERRIAFMRRSPARMVRRRPGPAALVELMALLERARDGYSLDALAPAVVEAWRNPDARCPVRRAACRCVGRARAIVAIGDRSDVRRQLRRVPVRKAG